jgi:hypothetical protein
MEGDELRLHVVYFSARSVRYRDTLIPVELVAGIEDDGC